MDKHEILFIKLGTKLLDNAGCKHYIPIRSSDCEDGDVEAVSFLINWFFGNDTLVEVWSLVRRLPSECTGDAIELAVRSIQDNPGFGFYPTDVTIPDDISFFSDIKSESEPKNNHISFFGDTSISDRFFCDNSVSDLEEPEITKNEIIAPKRKRIAHMSVSH